MLRSLRDGVWGGIHFMVVFRWDRVEGGKSLTERGTPARATTNPNSGPNPASISPTVARGTMHHPTLRTRVANLLILHLLPWAYRAAAFRSR